MKKKPQKLNPAIVQMIDFPPRLKKLLVASVNKQLAKLNKKP